MKALCESPGKPPGKVVTIVGIFSAGHGDFVARINLRDATQRGQQRETKLQLGSRSVRVGEEARHVVVADEGDQQLGMRIEAVLAEDIYDLLRRSPMIDDFANGRVHREIERSVEVGVDAVEAFLASGEIRDHRRLEVVDLADGEEIRDTWIADPEDTSVQKVRGT